MQLAPLFTVKYGDGDEEDYEWRELQVPQKSLVERERAIHKIPMIRKEPCLR